MTRVTIDFTTTFNNDAEEGDGPWLYQGSYDGYVNEVRVARNDYDYGYYGKETDLEPPFYVAYCEYYDGGTFGSDYYAEICNVYKTEEEAADFVERARAFSGFGEVDGYYIPWNGYFASLINVSYQRVV